jgi:hypothetical protein
MIDMVLTAGGLLMTVVLIIAGSLLIWAHNFVDNEIYNQLAAEQIYFPAANSAAVAAPEVQGHASVRRPAVNPTGSDDSDVITQVLPTPIPTRTPPDRTTCIQRARDTQVFGTSICGVVAGSSRRRVPALSAGELLRPDAAPGISVSDCRFR